MNIEIPLPRYIEIETSRKCNRTCSWCPNGEHTARRTQELMDWDLYRRIIDELGELGFSGWLAFHNYNEPLLNSRLRDEISYAAAITPDARPALYSNGDVLTSELVDCLVDAGVKYIRITRYPHHPDTPASAEEIRNWLRQKRLDGRFAWEFRTVRQGEAAVVELESVRIEVISPEILDTYNTRGGSVTMLPLHSVERTAPCLMTSTSASVDYLGRMKMCCCVYPDITDHASYVVGDLNTAGFFELWQSQQMSAYRTAHQAADWSLSKACRSCSQPLPETRL